jgi:predicted RNA polymerase sigma factor
LKHAIAAAMVHGPTKGLELLKPLDADSRLAESHRLDAVRGHLMEMAGDPEAAIEHYRVAAARTTSIPERNYLIAQAARLSDSKAGSASRQPSPSETNDRQRDS